MSTTDQNPMGLTEQEMIGAQRAAAANPDLYWHRWHHRISCRVSEIRIAGNDHADLMEIGMRNELAKLRAKIEANQAKAATMYQERRHAAIINHAHELATAEIQYRGLQRWDER